jgi:hypothetical protein
LIYVLIYGHTYHVGSCLKHTFQGEVLCFHPPSPYIWIHMIIYADICVISHMYLFTNTHTYIRYLSRPAAAEAAAAAVTTVTAAMCGVVAAAAGGGGDGATTAAGGGGGRRLTWSLRVVAAALGIRGKV